MEKRNKKVLISLTYYLPNISGVVFYVHWLAKGLLEKGYEVTILTSKHLEELKKEEIENGIRIVRVKPLFYLGKGAIMPLFPLKAYREIKKHDVVISNLPQFESVFLAFFGKVLGKKVFLVHHTDLSGWKGFLNQLSEKALNFSQNLAALLADLIIPYTKEYAEHSKFLKRYLNKVEPTFPPVEIAKPDKDYLESLKKEFHGSKYLIGFSGRIAKQKGIPYLLKAIPHLKKLLKAEFKIIFAGPYKGVIGENYFEKLKSLISKYPRQVVFLGNLSLSKLSAFYKLIDVLVLPSDDRLESFGIVQVEAMAQGTPVVVTDLPGVTVPVEKTGMGEIVSPKNSKELAKAIVKIILNPKKYSRSEKKIKRIFDFQKTINFYEKHIRS